MLLELIVYRGTKFFKLLVISHGNVILLEARARKGFISVYGFIRYPRGFLQKPRLNDSVGQV